MSAGSGRMPQFHGVGGYRESDLGLWVGQPSGLLETHYFGIDVSAPEVVIDVTVPSASAMYAPTASTVSPAVTVSATNGSLGVASVYYAPTSPPVAILVTAPSAAMYGSMSSAVVPIDVTVTTRRLVGDFRTGAGRRKPVVNALSPTKKPVIPVDRKHADDASSKFSREVRDAIRDVTNSPIPWGRIVEIEFEGAGIATEVSVFADRPVAGYLVIGLSAEAVIYDATPPQTPKRNTIYLQSTAAVKAKLWVF